MKKTRLNYLFLILILLAINISAAIFIFLFYELGTMLNAILDYSTILFFIITSIVLAKFIQKKQLSIINGLILIYLTLVIIRACEVFIFKNSFMMGSSFISVQVLFNSFSGIGEEYIYWWSVPVFPMFQPLGVLCFYKLFAIFNK